MTKLEKIWYKKIRPFILVLSVIVAIAACVIGVCCLDSEGWWAYIVTIVSMIYLLIVAEANL